MSFRRSLPLSPAALDRRAWLQRTLGTAGGLALAGLPGLSLAAGKVPASMNYAMVGEGKAEPGTVLRYGIGGMNPGAAMGGTKIEWKSGFAATLPIVEAIRGGAIDFSFATSTALIYAVGGKVPVVPLAAYPLPSNECEILVHPDSGIKSVKDLKGKRVADHRGTTSTYSLVRSLEAAGLTLSDIEYVRLTSADAEAAFANKRIDAWISWQPIMELARRRYDAQTLPGVTTYDYGFFIAREDFAKEYPEAVATLVRNVRDAQRLVEAKPEEAVAQFEALGGFGAKKLEREVYLDLVKARRLSYSGAGDMKLVDEKAASDVQGLADSFHELKIYPAKVAIKDFLLSPKHEAVKAAVAAEFARNA